MMGRSISVDWLSTLFPLVKFLAKYRHLKTTPPRTQHTHTRSHLSTTKHDIKTFTIKKECDTEEAASALETSCLENQPITDCKISNISNTLSLG